MADIDTEMVVGEVQIYEDNPAAGLYVYLCNLCLQPLPGKDSVCNSGAHVGPDGKRPGYAVKSINIMGGHR